MNSLLSILSCLLFTLPSLPIWAGQNPSHAPSHKQRLTVSVREADLRDLLRAASQGTDINLSFEPGLDTRIQGVDFKGVTLEELLEQVLPTYGLAYTRHGRTLYIKKTTTGDMRFYPIDTLAMRRMGSKSFSVNSSGQLMQGASQSGGASPGNTSPMGSGAGATSGGIGGNSSAYTSTIQMGNDSDPWQELEFGLFTLVFGSVPTANTTPTATTSATSGPKSKGFTKEGKSLLIQPDAGMVIVVADAAIHQRVASYLEEIKRRNRKQVLIEAKIVEVNLGNDLSMGVDWNVLIRNLKLPGGSNVEVTGILGNAISTTPTGSGESHLIVKGSNVQAALSALAKEERIHVLSAPRIATLNNQKAIWRVVQENAYFIQNSQVTPGGTTGNIATTTITPMIVPVGIILDILPQISDDGTIILAVSPSVSQVSGQKDLVSDTPNGARASIPEVNRRDLDAVVRVRSGDTLVLAGIIQNSESLTDKGVPWLRKVPFLGRLFAYQEKKRERTELAIFITPTLMETPDQIRTTQQQAEEHLQTFKEEAYPKKYQFDKEAP